jgi:hypothetical protein
MELPYSIEVSLIPLPATFCAYLARITTDLDRDVLARLPKCDVATALAEQRIPGFFYILKKKTRHPSNLVHRLALPLPLLPPYRRLFRKRQ